MKKILLTLGGCVFGMFLLAVNAHALTISISPTSLINKQILPGSNTTYSYIFALSNLDEDMNIKIVTSLPDCADWLSIDPGNSFLYKKGQINQEIKLTLNVPANAPLKACKGNVSISADKAVPQAGVTNLNSGVNIGIDLALTNENIKELKVTSVSVKTPTQGQDIVLDATVYNMGNVSAAISKATMAVTDISGKSVATLDGEGFENLDAFANKTVSIKFKNQLLTGQYFGDVQLFYNDKVVFKDRVVLNIPVESGDSITAVFSNQYLPYYLIALALGTLGTVVFVVIILRHRMTKKSVVVAAILLIPLFALLGYVGYALGTNYLQTKSLNSAGLSLIVPAKTAEVTPSPQVTPQLLGASTVRGLPENEKPTSNGMYKVYSKPDFNSAVLTMASQNATFTAVDAGDWFKIQVGKDFGYIPKSSITKIVAAQ